MCYLILGFCPHTLINNTYKASKSQAHFFQGTPIISLNSFSVYSYCDLFMHFMLHQLVLFPLYLSNQSHQETGSEASNVNIPTGQGFLMAGAM